MKYCTECGNSLNPHNKFCSNCGKKNTLESAENKIDKTAEKINQKFRYVKNEISESEVVDKFSKNLEASAYVVEKGINKFYNFLFKILGILSLTTIIIYIIHPFITGDQFILNSIIKRNLEEPTGYFPNRIGFFAEVLFFIIAPLLFFNLGFKKWIVLRGLSLFAIATVIIILIYGLFIYK